MKSGWKLTRAGAVLLALLAMGLGLVLFGSGKIVVVGGLLIVVSVLAMAPDLFTVRFGGNVVSRPREKDVQAQAELARSLAGGEVAQANAAEREALLAREAASYRHRMSEPPTG